LDVAHLLVKIDMMHTKLDILVEGIRSLVAATPYMAPLAGIASGPASSTVGPEVEHVASTVNVLASTLSPGSSSANIPANFAGISCVSPAKLQSTTASTVYGIGSVVWIHGLASRPELNNCMGTIVAALGDDGRYGVRVEGSSLFGRPSADVRVRSANVRGTLFWTQCEQQLRRSAWRFGLSSASFV
jgi:hypothetical protein